MAQQTINVGAAPNDGTGTPLRTAFQYTNQNFTELYTALGGGVGLPGATTQVIFNDGGTNLAGDAGLVYNKTTDALTVGGLVTAASATITGNLTVDTSTLFVDSSNDRVGIGTATPAAKLIVRDGSNRNFLVSSDAAQLGSAGVAIGSFTDNAAGYAPLSIIAGTSIAFGLNGSTAMTLNSSVLAMGVTPNTWTIYKALQVQGASIFSTTGNDTGFGSNVYYDGGYKFRSASSDKATRYEQFGGSHSWHYTASPGTAGNTATFTQAMTLDASGRLLVGPTSANANGGVLQLSSGITFPATQVASSDANTLDDYEEGNFTPTIIGSTTAGTGVYTLNQGRYTKIGNRVFCDVYISWSAHTGTGNILLEGLPFTSNAAISAIKIGLCSNLALTAGNILTGVTSASSTQISFQQYPSGGGARSAVPMDTAAEIQFSVCYFV